MIGISQSDSFDSFTFNTPFITPELASLSSDKRLQPQDFSRNFINFVDFTGCVNHHFGS
jgi:hypothetical protein